MASARPQYRFSMAAAALAAALGCLQPGIDPVFLSLLSQSSRVPLTAHGLIVGATQAGAALGSLAVWRLGSKLPHKAVILAASIAMIFSLITVRLDSMAAILAVRSGYGLAMGIVYAYSMGAYAANKPNRAFGAVFLIQLILSTAVSLVLPELDLAAGGTVALAILALVPTLAIVALMAMPTRDHAPDGHRDDVDQPVSAKGWALAAATFWFICATMLIWSFSAALAKSAGLDTRTIAQAVSLGSLCGALTAVAMMREKLLVPLPVTALFASAALIAPILMTVPGGNTQFIIAIVFLNIGSTAIIIRCSGLAAASSTNPGFLTFVACTHSLGLIAGPLLGSFAVLLPIGLSGGLLIALSMGLGAVGWAGLPSLRRQSVDGARTIANSREIALD